MNTLEATSQEAEIGAQNVASAEARAIAPGAVLVGLAARRENVDACRLYERLGYVEWEHGNVFDRWSGMALAMSLGNAPPCAGASWFAGTQQLTTSLVKQPAQPLFDTGPETCTATGALMQKIRPRSTIAGIWLKKPN